MKTEIVLFTDGDKNIEVQVSPDKETVWLTQKQMEELFDVKQATISEHINNILSEGELDDIYNESDNVFQDISDDIMAQMLMKSYETFSGQISYDEFNEIEEKNRTS